ncbi:MAG: amidohydrolase family protein [Nitriliruptoraceae bacterium]
MRTHLLDVQLVHPSRGPDEQSSHVTIEGGVITRIDRQRPAIADGDDVIDLEGRVATPGLVNAHDHLYSHALRDPLPGWGLPEMREWLDARDVPTTLSTMITAALDELTQGITTVRDLGARHGLNTHLARIVGGQGLIGPTVVAAGRPVVMTGGHVHGFGREADGPWDCRRAVREQVKAGAKVIKIMGSGGLSHYPAEDFGLPQFTEEELAAIVAEARSAGVPTCAHVFGADAVARVVAAGVDSVEHGVRIHDDTLEEMARRDVAYVPTLANMRRIASNSFNEAAGIPDRAAVLTEGVVTPHAETFARAVEAGVKIGLGTDSTGTYLEEIEAMVEIGLPFDRVLVAATTDGAAICRQPAGTLALGQRADLAIYDEMPATAQQLVSPSTICAAGRTLTVGSLQQMLGDAGPSH